MTSRKPGATWSIIFVVAAVVDLLIRAIAQNRVSVGDAGRAIGDALIVATRIVASTKIRASHLSRSSWMTPALILLVILALVVARAT
jgi:hypothetical protein